VSDDITSIRSSDVGIERRHAGFFGVAFAKSLENVKTRFGVVLTSSLIEAAHDAGPRRPRNLTGPEPPYGGLPSGGLFVCACGLLHIPFRGHCAKSRGETFREGAGR
jgi:hypothetical protein